MLTAQIKINGPTLSKIISEYLWKLINTEEKYTLPGFPKVSLEPLYICYMW